MSKLEKMDVSHFKSNKTDKFIKKHRPEEDTLAAMAYDLPRPNVNFVRAGDFLNLKKRLRNS